MSFQKKIINSNGREWTIVTINKGKSSIDIIPEAGFGITSFKWQGRELMLQWDLDEFLGDTTQIEFITNNITDTFRKGFGPAIGPWFNAKEPNTKIWQHGVCRYAEWKTLEIGNNFIKGRLDGKKDRLLGKTLNEICGFDFAVEITYTLLEEGLEYRVKNLSEGNKGTFGIHWYWNSYINSKIHLKTDTNHLPKDLTENRYKINKGEVITDLNTVNGDIFKAVSSGLDDLKGQLVHADGSRVNFYYDDTFTHTVLWSPKTGCCFEPVSGMPHQLGTFTEGVIRMFPS